MFYVQATKKSCFFTTGDEYGFPAKVYSAVASDFLSVGWVPRVFNIPRSEVAMTSSAASTRHETFKSIFPLFLLSTSSRRHPWRAARSHCSQRHRGSSGVKRSKCTPSNIRCRCRLRGGDTTVEEHWCALSGWWLLPTAGDRECWH